jgi:hypothetical protein
MFNRLYFHGAADFLNALGFLAAYLLWAEILENPSVIHWTWMFVLSLFAVNMLIAMANIVLHIRDVVARENAKLTGT